MTCLRPHSKEAVDLSSNPGLWMLKLVLLSTMLSYFSFPDYQIHPSGQVTWLYYVMLRVPAPIWMSVFFLWRKKKGLYGVKFKVKRSARRCLHRKLQDFQWRNRMLLLHILYLSQKICLSLTLSDTFYHAISCPSFSITVSLYPSLFKYFYN